MNNEFKILCSEGYKMFEGTMTIYPKDSDAFEMAGMWLYKPEYKCWYANGRSFSEDICEIKQVNTPTQEEPQNIVLHVDASYEEDKMLNAIEEAYRGINAGHGGPFGTAIVKDGHIIALGHNHVVSNNDPTCHGEIDAIRKACRNLGTFDLSGCELYTTSSPCLMCLGAILWANIDKVYYGCTIADAEEIGFRDNIFDKEIKELRQQIEKPLMREECLKLFEAYSNMRHTKY